MIHRGEIQRYSGSRRGTDGGDGGKDALRQDSEGEQRQLSNRIVFFLGDQEAACTDAKRVSATVPMSRFQKHIPQRLISLHSSGIVLYQYDMYSAPPSFYVSRKIMFIFPFKHSPDILILVYKVNRIDRHISVCITIPSVNAHTIHW